MFKELTFQRKLAALQAAKRKMAKEFNALEKKAREAGKKEEAESMDSQASFEWQMAQADIDYFITDYLRETAESLLIPVPRITGKDDDPFWTRDMYDHRYVLTDAGIKKLRDDIHDEVKKRWERRFIWVQPLSGLLSFLVALGGVFAALLSVWIKH